MEKKKSPPISYTYLYMKGRRGESVWLYWFIMNICTNLMCLMKAFETYTFLIKPQKIPKYY